MGGDVKVPDVPHYSRYRWENHPQWVEHQKLLAEKGLHDPWARNHVWRYMHKPTNNRLMPWYMLWTVNHPILRGFSLAVGTLGAYIVYDRFSGRHAQRQASKHH